MVAVLLFAVIVLLLAALSAQICDSPYACQEMGWRDAGGGYCVRTIDGTDVVMPFDEVWSTQNE